MLDPPTAMPSMPLTVVHVLGSFEIGGGEQVALNLAAGQKKRGHRVHVVSLAAGPDGPHAHHFEAANVTTHRVPKLGPTVDPTLVLRMARLFQGLKADVVHTHNPQPLIYGGPAARLSRTPLVHTKHGFNAAPPRQVWLRKWPGWLAQAFVAVSARTAQDARDGHECRPERLSVIENGIHLDLYRPNPSSRSEVRRELGIPESAIVVGTVGRLSSVKNQPLLVRALAPLLHHEMRLVLVGDGPDRADVEAEVERSGKANWIQLLGQRLDVPRLLPAFDIFALSSDSEGLPMVLPEAMACELPIVSTAVGGIPEVVTDNETGYLVPKGDEVGLRESVAKLAAAPGLVKKIGAQGREFALRRYSAESMIERYLQLYQVLQER